MNLAFVSISFYLFSTAGAQNSGCDFYQALNVGQKYEIFSRGYKSGKQAQRNEACRWAAEAPPGFKVSLKCDYVFLFPLFGCANNLKISLRGRKDLADSESYCGFLGSIAEKTSLSTKMTVSFNAGLLPVGSRFHCEVTSVVDSCVCGRRNNGKIVGGDETIVNEFPPMAGLIDNVEGIICGATIISRTVAVSAAHCFTERHPNLQLVVGEHDILKKTETAFTKTYNIVKVTKHEAYDSESAKRENDIALVFTGDAITLNDGVGLSCLPISFRGNNNLGSMVIGVGWGAIEFAGPRSSFLRKVNLEAVNSSLCSDKQICTFAPGRDLCTFDSGGPVFLSKNGLVFNIGIVSYGTACATKNAATNTRVSTFIDWIMSNTKSIAYCVK